MYDNFDTKERKKINPLVLMFIIIQVMVFAILAFIANGIFAGSADENVGGEDQRRIESNGLAENLDWLSVQDIEEVEKALFKKMKMNSIGMQVENVGAVVREGSTRTLRMEENGSDFLSFVVDLPDMGQSYRVYYAYPETIFDSENLAIALCLDSFDEKIYAEFNCVDMEEDEEGRVMIVATVVEGIEYNDFWVNVDEDLRQIRINVLPAVEVNDEVRSRYISEVKQIVENLGVSPGMFEYKVMTPDDYVDSLEEGEIYGG